MKLGTFLAHASFRPERIPSSIRVVGELVRGRPPSSMPFVLSSDSREPAHVWAMRLWMFALSTNADFFLFLNDDIHVHPELVRIVEVLGELFPREVLSLHTQLTPRPMSEGPWLRSYMLTGPAYAMGRERLSELVNYAEAHMDRFRSTNEDNLANDWLWSASLPAWHTVPALVQHDTSIPSTYPGFDRHPHRTSPIPWTLPRFKEAELTDWRYWNVAEAPPLMPALWGPGVNAGRTWDPVEAVWR